MFCPVLRYAVYTASSGHLARLSCINKAPNNEIMFNGVRLPTLTAETAIRYHDMCISCLLEISKDPNEQYNEDVLTAATILRFYEHIDGTSFLLSYRQPGLTAS